MRGSARIGTSESTHDVSSSLVEQQESGGASNQVVGAEVKTLGSATVIDSNVGEVVGMHEEFQDIAIDSMINEQSIDKFFSRPVELVRVPYSTFITTSYTPWLLYLNRSKLTNKLETFAYIRGTLNLKITVNGSPFRYGSAMSCYYPANFDASAGNIGTSVSDIVSLSQLKHVMLYPHLSQGGEFSCPMIYNRDYCELRERDNFEKMGVLINFEVAPIRSLNADVTSDPTVVMYAYMTDVKLLGQTAAAVLQSEYVAKGAISKNASNVAKIADKLSDIPVIGPYARATELGATAIGKIASLFGYTNVPEISNYMPFRNQLLGNTASCEIGNPVEKLTLDPKNELSIDPKILGASEDDMAIERLVQRETKLTVLTWPSSSVATTVLFTSCVQPNLQVVNLLASTGTPYEVIMTPMAAVASLFSYWRGDIIFTFECVASQFHRGRLLITWDPETVPDVTELNHESVCQLWDISQSSKTEFRVPYQQSTYYQAIYKSVFEGFSNDSLIPLHRQDCINGFLRLSVLNTLQSPEPVNAAVSIVVSVRAADGFEFAGPAPALPLGPSAGFPSIALRQSQMILFDDQQEKTHSAINTTSINPNAHLVHMGENVKSLKPLFQRSNLYWTNASAGILADGFYITRMRLPRRPAYPGYSTNGFIVSGANRINGVSLTPYSYCAPWFIMERGAHNYNVVFRSEATVQLAVSRWHTPPGNAERPYLYTNQAESAQNNITLANGGSNGVGLTVADKNYNPSSMVSMPLYSQYRGLWTNPSIINESTIADPTPSQRGEEDGQNADAIDIQFRHNGTIAQLNTLTAYVYHNVGTDFGLYHFRCIPKMYYYAAYYN